MPAAGNDAAVIRFGGSLAVNMERLRIELLREIDDFLIADLARPDFDGGADCKVLEIPFQLRQDFSTNYWFIQFSFFAFPVCAGGRAGGGAGAPGGGAGGGGRGGGGGAGC